MRLQALQKVQQQKPGDLSSTRIPLPIKYYLSLSVVFWFCCLSLQSFWRFVQHRPFPYKSPFMPAELCRDLWCYRPQFLALHTPDFFKYQGMEMFPYPPATAIPFAVFQNILPQFHSIPYIFLTFLGVACIAGALARGLIRLEIAFWKAISLSVVAFLLIFPFWFVWVTGNIEIVLFLLLSCGVFLFLRGRFKLAAIFIGFCAAMKFYPFVLLVLLLPAKRYREIGIGIATFIVANMAGLWVMCPNIHFAYLATRKAMQTNRVDYMETFLTPQSAADHSIWGSVKTVLFTLTRHTHYPSWSVAAYLACTALLGITLYFGRIRHLPILNQVFSLYLCMLLFVPESFEYTLIHLTVPFCLLVLYTVRRSREGLDVKYLTPVFVCLAFVLAPENELILHHHGVWGPAKCVALVALLGLLLTRRLNSDELDLPMKMNGVAAGA